MAPSRLVIWLAGALLAWLALHELHVVVPGLDGFGGPVFGRWVHVGLMAAGGIAVLLRALSDSRERLAWGLIAGALLAWTTGEAYFTHVLWDLASPPVPSPADAGFLLFPLLALAGIVALARARVRVRGADRMMAADAATAALAAGAVSAATVFGAVVQVVGGDRLALATNLAYPVADLLLLAAIVGVGGLQGWRVSRTWLLLALGCLSFTVTDGVYLVQVAKGTWVSGGPWDAGWWAAAPLWALAAWTRPGAAAVRAHDATSGGVRSALPLAFAATALAVLVAATIWDVNLLAVGLAAAALVASIARLNLTLRAHAASLRLAQGEALTDALTGLGNRRLLRTDLDERLGEGRELMLVVFDLDGFKHYNDVFGHPAGDEVLARLATRLRTAVGSDGGAYRLGGDEFCALLVPSGRSWEERLDACTDALSEEGEGYLIGCSHGAILLPHEAADATDAMRLADQRMYACKQDGRLSAIRQATDALLRAMSERFPELEDHTAEVAELAAATARTLEMNREEVEEVRRAAELHDIGKVAIPEMILEKRGPLDPAEWWHIRRHTVIGERIVGAAPALGRVAKIVRSTHERHAGGGYPDDLSGEEIPLGARVVAVCDAFDAMTRTRPYRDAMHPERALAELERCAGDQFDPEVVRAFVETWRRQAGLAGDEPGAAAA